MSVQRERLIGELHAAGYFRYTMADHITEIKDMFITGEGPYTEYPYIFDARTGRVAPLDAENVAEGGAETELMEMRDTLMRFGVNLESVEVEQPDEAADYTLRVNGITYLILSATEMADERDWYEATQRLIAILNSLLKSVSAEERAYLLYIGELSLVVFLTPRMFDVLQLTSELHLLEKPQAVEMDPIVVD